MYFLQDYIQSNHIASMVIYESLDSLNLKKRIKNRLYFDKRGRMVKVRDYFFMSDTLAEREINYKYTGESPYFSSKVYCYLNEKGEEIKHKVWDIQTDQTNHVVTEFFKQGEAVFRKNVLTFDAQDFLLVREVNVGEIEYNLGFIYSEQGLLSRAALNVVNPTVENNNNYLLTTYFQYDTNQNILNSERWIGEKEKQLQAFYYVYKGQAISSKVGWSFEEVSGDLVKVIARTNFKYNTEGMLEQANSFKEKKVAALIKYTTFEYTFYPHSTTLGKGKVKSDIFTWLMFSNLFEIIQNK
ncbi:hypothetical protein [Putridiphycobacter roseus]|nr:hypothetical protein [Putridiphycobacter roseus]